MPQSAFINPVSLPEQLNSAEREFVQCMAEGRECIIGATRPDKAIDEGENANVIHADIVRFFAWGGSKRDPFAGNTIVLRGAHISGSLDLTSVSSRYALSLTHCYFHAPIKMQDAAFRSLRLGGSYLPQGLQATGVQINGDVFMNSGFFAAGGVYLAGAKISGYLICGNSEFKNKGEAAITADRIKVGGNVVMGKGFVAEGEVRMPSADIVGQLICSDGVFKNKKGKAIHADGVSVKGDVFMRDGFIAEGEVRLLNADIGGQLICDSGTIKKEKGKAFNADGISVKGSVFMRNGFATEGEVRFPNANIGENVYCNGGIFGNKGGHALLANGIKIGGNLALQKGFSAEGEVSLFRANIGGSVYCNEGTFKNEGGRALAGDRIAVGSLFMDGNFSATGEVRLAGADVRGDVHCNGGKFRNEKGNALVADRIKVGGVFSLRSGFSAEGEVRISAADINGSLYCNGGEFKKGFYARATKVRHSYRWHNVKGNGTVDLSFAAVDVLADDEKSRENFDFRLSGFSYQRLESPGKIESRIREWLDKRPAGVGFSPQPFEQAAKVLFAMGHNDDAREVLLAKERRLTAGQKTPAEYKPCWRRFWDLLNDTFGDTQEVEPKKKRLLVSQEKMSGWRKFARQVWDIFAGYGYRLRRTLAWSAGVVLAGMFVFDFADRECRIVPHQPIVLASTVYINAKTEQCVVHRQPTKFVAEAFPAYPRFEPFFYSLDVFIPFFALHMESHWYPQPEDGDANLVLFFLRVWYWFEIFMGWVLTSLLVLTITGLLKPRQSSLE